MQTFEVDGTQYELKYSARRLELIESNTGIPTITYFVNNKGFMTLQQLKLYVGLAIRETGSETFIAAKKGQELAQGLIEHEGYETVQVAVIEQLMEDCPFLFPKS